MYKYIMIKIILGVVLLSAVCCSSIGAQKELAVTIYNNNFAMVKDIRDISFDEGESTLYFTDVSANIQTETVTFKALKNPTSVRVYEQNFEKNLVNTNGILQRYIEKEITLYVQLASMSKVVKGILLGYNSGYIIKTQFGINIFNNIAGLEFPSLPDDFFTVPTLNWKVWSETAQTTSCEVAYRTTGFSWKADYSISLNKAQTRGDIGGWVTIDNNSGKKYLNAKLKLIAGDVNTVSNNNYNSGIQYNTFARAESAPSFSQKSFADYHLYTLSKPVTLNETSQKQVQFIPKVYNASIDKYHEITISAGGYNQQNIDAINYIRFLNSQSNGLGIPFPKGIFRVFKTDEADGSLEFIGEDRIDHSPKNQNITLKTGKAFDIVANKYAESRKTVGTRGYEASLNMTVVNHKETTAEVVVLFNNNYGDNLELTWNGDVKLEKLSATQYSWRKLLQPDEKWVVEWKQFYSA